MLMNAANTNKKNNQRDVSFTFLDRVREVELNLEDGRWQSALALALTIPDICGGIGFPGSGKALSGRQSYAGQTEAADKRCGKSVYPLV